MLTQIEWIHTPTLFSTSSSHTNGSSFLYAEHYR
jgi:hypothetical protein